MEQPNTFASRTPVPTAARTVDPKISSAQRAYLLDLIEKKSVKADQEGKLDMIMKCLRISEDPEEYGMGRNKASELIDWFKKQPNKSREVALIAVVNGETNCEIWSNLPPGRYAVENAEGELRFYQVWEKYDRAKRIYVMHGPDSSALAARAALAVAKKIVAAGVRECAIRYGMEIGHCSNCGLRLTNRISRELGIGPVCGRRMFGDSFKVEVKAKRAEIKARGEDPNEVMS